MWWSVLTRVFSKWRYTILGLSIFFTGLSIVLLLPNLTLVAQIITADSITISAKLAFLVSFYGSITTNFTFFSAGYTLILLLLFAVNFCLLVFYLRRAQQATKNSKRIHLTGVAGVVSGVLGIGCAACGSVILTGLAASVGATGLLLALPLHGGEMALLGILLLLISIRYLVQKIDNPLVCRI